MFDYRFSMLSQTLGYCLQYTTSAMSLITYIPLTPLNHTLCICMHKFNLMQYNINYYWPGANFSSTNLNNRVWLACIHFNKPTRSAEKVYSSYICTCTAFNNWWYQSRITGNMWLFNVASGTFHTSKRDAFNPALGGFII